jgi:hypothetical protein
MKKTKKQRYINKTQTFKNKSYSPTVNLDLVSLKSISRKKIYDCNNKNAFKLKEVLKIGIPNNKCVPYYSEEAIQFLLKNLSANKHINVNKIIPPIQKKSNCWFNTMFMTLFVSDKGRKFMHFFRQLMIKGEQANGNENPKKLNNAFALFNYSIEMCLTGNKYAYSLDTNAIIGNIYKNIPTTYKKEHLPYIKNINEAGNPLNYFNNILYYLNNKSIEIMLLKNANEKWYNKLTTKIEEENTHLPHIIVLEFYDDTSKITNKPLDFKIKNKKYTLDSSIIRDVQKQHFSATLMCEGIEYAYDGLSFHRIINMQWKKNINKNVYWSFKGSNNYDKTPLKWNFAKGYQMLIYYRVE